MKIAPNCADITLISLEGAKTVLDRLNEIVNRCKFASVSDFYDLIGLKSSYSDTVWGWTNLSGTNVIETHNGFSLSLPQAELYVGES